MSELISAGGPESNADCDVVFVHGLNGDGKTTWMSGGKEELFWPKWIAADLNQAAVWSISYDIKALSWKKGTLPMADRANNILSLLASNDIGSKPLAFVCHSFGGLLVKQMLRNALELGDKSWARLASNTKGVVFLSTPHHGSNKADWFKWFASLLAPSVAVDELQSEEAQLRNLNQWYRSKGPENAIETAVFYETLPTKAILIVDPGSADPGIANLIPTPVDADHVEISKPLSRDSHVYRAVRHFLRLWLSNDFAKDIHSRVIVRIDQGPRAILSEHFKTAALEEGASTFPDGTLEFPTGSMLTSSNAALFFAIKKPSVALRAGIEFMQRWHAHVLRGLPDCRILIDEGTVAQSGLTAFKDIDPMVLTHLPISALYVSEAIVDGADRTMATFSAFSLPKESRRGPVFRAEFEDPRTVRDSGLIHAFFVAHPDAESVRKRLFELFVVEYLTQNGTIKGTKDFFRWLTKRGLPIPASNWVVDLISSSEYFEVCEGGESLSFKIRDAQAKQIEENRKTFEESRTECIGAIERSLIDATTSKEAAELTDLTELVEEYLSAVFLEIRLMANYLRRTDQVFDSAAAPLRKFDYVLNRRLGGLSAGAADTWRNAFIRGLKKAAETNNVYVASVFHNVLATYYLNRSQGGAQHQRNKLRGRIVFIDTNILYAARVRASTYNEIVSYLLFQLDELGFEVRIFPFSVEEYEHSIGAVERAVHDGVPEPWVLQRLPWIYQEFKINSSAYLTMAACRQVHSIAKKESISPDDYDSIDEQLRPLKIRLDRDFSTIDPSTAAELWSGYVNQMGSNKWGLDKWWEFRNSAMSRSDNVIRHDVLSLANVANKAERAGVDEFGPRALFLTLDSEHLLRLRRTHPFIVGVQQCQEYFLPYVFLNDIPVKQVVEFPNQLLSNQLGMLFLKYRPKAIEIVESALRSSSPWQLMDSDKLPTLYQDVARSFNQDRLRDTVRSAQEHPETISVIAEQVGALLERESQTALQGEFAVRARDLRIARLQEEVEKERKEKARIRSELDKATKTNKYLKSQRNRPKGKK